MAGLPNSHWAWGQLAISFMSDQKFISAKEIVAHCLQIEKANPLNTIHQRSCPARVLRGRGSLNVPLFFKVPVPGMKALE
jgi:hypothetical protein